MTAENTIGLAGQANWIRKPGLTAWRHRLRQVCISFALAVLVPLCAEAALVEMVSFTATGSYSRNILPVSSSSLTSPISVGLFVLPDGAPDPVSIHVYGHNSSGYAFGSSSQGLGTYTATGTIHYQNVIINNGGATVQLAFDFVVSPGQLSVNCGLSLKCDGSASHDMLIQVDGSTVSGGQSSGKLDINMNGTSLATSGFSLSGLSQSGIAVGSKKASYEWLATSNSINLGSLLPGQTLTLDYFYTTTVIGNFDSSIGQVCVPSGSTVACSIGTGSPGGGTQAGGGDPGGLNPTGQGVVVVPEPGTLALLSVAGVWFLARRRWAGWRGRLSGHDTAPECQQVGGP